MLANTMGLLNLSGPEGPHYFGASERHYAGEHRALEVPAVLDVVHGEAEVLLVDVLTLDEQTGDDEPARPEFPPVRADVIHDARKVAIHPVVTGANEDFFG